MKKVIINGATGLLGNALIGYLDKEKYCFTILARDESKARKIFPGCEAVGYKDPLMPGIFENCYAVLNLAGASIGGRRWNDNYKRLLYSSRINSTKNIAYAVTRTLRKPSVFINASATGYYGFRDDFPALESSPAGKDFLARLCDDWEAGTHEIENSGIRTVKLRTAVILSRLGGALDRLAKPFRFFAGGKLGTGNQPFPFIHIRDMVRIIEFIMENESINGAVNCVSPEQITNKEFSKALGKVLKRPSLLTVPAFVLKLALGEFAETILNGRFVIPDKLINNGFVFDFPDAVSALNDIYKN